MASIKPRIFIIGPSGSGKSTLKAHLSAVLGKEGAKVKESNIKIHPDTPGLFNKGNKGLLVRQVEVFCKRYIDYNKEVATRNTFISDRHLIDVLAHLICDADPEDMTTTRVVNVLVELTKDDLDNRRDIILFRNQMLVPSCDHHLKDRRTYQRAYFNKLKEAYIYVLEDLLGLKPIANQELIQPQENIKVPHYVVVDFYPFDNGPLITNLKGMI